MVRLAKGLNLHVRGVTASATDQNESKTKTLLSQITKRDVQHEKFKRDPSGTDSNY